MKTNMKVIDRLFHVMKTKYGSYWVDIYTFTPVDEVKMLWLSKLIKFTPDNIGKAINCVKEIYTHLPPDSSQFSELVNSLKNSNPANEIIKEFDYGEMKKTNNTGFREKIREDFGV